MRRVADGDTEAFALLVARYRPQLRAFFASVLPDSTQADDFAQETLLRLWLSRRTWKPTGVFSAYVFQIGRHFLLNHRVRLRVHARQACLTDDLFIAAPVAVQPEMVAIERAEARKRRAAINALPERLRVVFTLSHFDGCRYAEIAQRLNIPAGTVKSRMSAAVKRLRAALEEQEG